MRPGLDEAARPRELTSSRRNNSKDTASSISLKLGNIFSHWTLFRKFLNATGPSFARHIRTW
jgi:hypothetical protein